MDQNLKLIMEVKKHEYLYNSELLEYCRKDLIEKGWLEISAKMGLPVSECRVKWQNIRTVFLRNVKKKHPCRPYYLSEELSFLVPHLSPFARTAPGPGSMRNNNDVTEVADRERSSDSENLLNKEDILSVSILAVQNTEMNDDNQSELRHRHRRRLKVYDTKAEARNLSEYQKKQHKASSIKHFFQSLVLDVESMTPDQARQFKIDVLMLIDKIKNSS